MKDLLIQQITMSWLKPAQKLRAIYFIISLMTVMTLAEATTWAIFLIVANFALSAYLVRNIPMPKVN